MKPGLTIVELIESLGYDMIEEDIYYFQGRNLLMLEKAKEEIEVNLWDFKRVDEENNEGKNIDVETKFKNGFKILE